MLFKPKLDIEKNCNVLKIVGSLFQLLFRRGKGIYHSLNAAVRVQNSLGSPRGTAGVDDHGWSISPVGDVSMLLSGICTIQGVQVSSGRQHEARQAELLRQRLQGLAIGMPCQ